MAAGKTKRGRPRSKRPITPGDLLKFQLVSDPQVSPDGKRVLFSKKHVEKNEYVTNLWVVESMVEMREEPRLRAHRTRPHTLKRGAIAVSCIVMLMAPATGADPKQPPESVRRWLAPQNWVRDTEGPAISLGKPEAFDDTHIFAPCVAYEKGRYSLWYCGSRGSVAQRVFHLGLATSRDGRQFIKHGRNPVFAFGDGKHSVLTPTLLRNPDGSVLRENGKLRMWFSATHFGGKSGLHTLHQTTGADGIDWSAPSPAQLKNIYAPTVIKDSGAYRMWYTDVTRDPWLFRHASSKDGQRWDVTAMPVLQVDQPWEKTRLFYPAVLRSGSVYLMWYGSYWSGHPSKTAIGFAASADGITWYKHPHNPVLRPDPQRPWESHYTTSQSVMRLPDGSWRIWYASRKKPPFVNKYFAIGTARWNGPPSADN